MRGPGESYGDVIMRLARGGFRAALLVLSGGINDGVAESTHRVPHQREESWGPHFRPAQRPNARGD